MIDLIKKHWITSLGILFLFSAFTYFLKIAFENGWFPPEIRVLSGFAIGVTLLFSGFTYYRKSALYTCQILAGSGISIIYATFTYVAFTDDLNWPYNVMLISVLALSALTTLISYKYELRGLIFISVLGGLLSPILMKAEAKHDMVLFSYVLIINLGSLYVSIAKKWQELRIMTFVATVLVYATYYIYFDPTSWGRPFFYAATLFMVYMGGIIFASHKEKDQFTGWNLYLSLLNAMLFIFWSIYILGSFDITFTVPLLVVGFTFMIASVFVYLLSGRNIFPGLIYVCLGLVLFAISAANIKPMNIYGMEYVATTLLWFMVITGAYSIGQFVKSYELRYVSYAAWMMLIIYWFTVAWDVQWITIWGIRYIPFINAGAFTWMILAAFGFYMGKKEQKDNPVLSNLFAIVSNIIVAALFTVQIRNIWTAYNIDHFSRPLAISISYIVYALLIFLWGAHTKAKTFRILGTIVILFTSAKVFFWDLSGSANISKMIFLMIIGLLTLGIAHINKRWLDKEEKDLPEHSEKTDANTEEA
ncbi:DUF2339 domain-containing protein [Carboxylicivirga caseinilyticus]|uniref:DUF2339 domain-containing protein n=1 Tax=Carboxylicivirga caseinilyticus TaxID=3417572 RepID=UPI003D359094|nr:DUF2339 domain-containing protein [Marinilabiliaceae bacterium A049]